MEIRIVEEKCIGCKKCLPACPFKAIEVRDGKAVLLENCTFCGSCVSSCKFDAIVAIGEKPQPKVDLSAWKGVLVIGETLEGKLLKVSLELASKGRELADKVGGELMAVAIGADVASLADEFGTYGVEKVFLAENKSLGRYRTEPWAEIVTKLIQDIKPEIVLFGATPNGRDLAPRVANRLQTGLTADCTGLEIDEEEKILLQTRPAFGGNIMATIVCPNNRPQMSTVRPGVMKLAENAKKPEVTMLDTSAYELKSLVEILEVVKQERKHVNLEEADIIVSGGRGLGAPEHFGMIREFAEMLGGEAGASRAAVDMGWIDHDHQVGQTGKTVCPRIYFAFGISGAVQHQVGMMSSGYIVAVNKDPNAPIFEIADFGIVGDLHQVVPALKEEISSYLKNKRR